MSDLLEGLRATLAALRAREAEALMEARRLQERSAPREQVAAAARDAEHVRQQINRVVHEIEEMQLH